MARHQIDSYTCLHPITQMDGTMTAAMPCDLPDNKSVTLGSLLDRAARLFPDHEALVSQGQRIDYRTLHRRVESFAQGLLGLGIRHGDHVVLWMPNWIEWNIAFHAIAKIGAVVVTCNTRYKAIELEYLLRNSDARALIMPARFDAAQVDFLALLREAMPGLVVGANEGRPAGKLEHLILLDDELPCDLGIAVHGFAGLEKTGTTAHADPDAAPNTVTVQPDDVVLMIYTSGTTGAPKGCMLSHRTVFIRAEQRTRMFPWQPAERMLVTMPYFHIAGILGPIVGSTLKGTTQVVIDKFDPRVALGLIEQEKITFMSGVPTMFIGMLSQPDFNSFDIRSLRTITLGSADIPPQLMRQLIDPKVGLGLQALVMYGQTETGGSTHCSKLDDPIELLVGTSGVPVEGIEDRIVNAETGEDCPAGTAGEIWVRGEGMMTGFYGMPEATAAKTVDGWLRTGDVGIKDDSGHLKITGRLSDVILVGGFNTYPAEIEHLLHQHPDIAEAAVVGVPDPVMGQAVMAFVVPRHDRLQAAEVRSFLNGRIANYKVPRYVKVVDALPQTASGKVQKFRLLEALQDETLADYRIA